MKDLRASGGIDWPQVVRTEIPRDRKDDWLLAGDILFVCKGTRFYAGCVDQPPGRAVCTPHFFHLRVLPEARVLPDFLAWIINQAPVQKQLSQVAEGSNQLSIRRPVLEAVTVRIPSLAQQHRLVALAELARRERHVFEQLVHIRERELEALAEELSAA